MIDLAYCFIIYGSVIVPTAVLQEIQGRGENRVGVSAVRVAVAEGWISTKSPGNPEFVTLLKQQLDDGEAEAIALAVEIQANLILLDDAEARRFADIYKLNKTGVIGILLRAKVEGLIPALRPELNRLTSRMWISPSLLQRALEAVGEG